MGNPIDNVSDHNLIQEMIEGIFIEDYQVTQKYSGEVDIRTLHHQETHQKDCVKLGIFDSNPYINSRGP